MLDMKLFTESEKKKNIIVIGTIFVDIKGYPSGGFIPKGRNIGHIETRFGGVGRNVAANLAGLDIPCTFVSLADPDGYGAAIVEDLKKSGVNTDYVLMHENGVGTWLAIFDSSGDVYANISKRQDLRPLCEMLDLCGEELFRDADGILLEMDMDEEVVEQVFAYAEKYRVDVYGVISNMSVAMERMPYIQKTRCFICNRQEAEMLVQYKITTSNNNPSYSIINDAPKEKPDFLVKVKNDVSEEKANTSVEKMNEVSEGKPDISVKDNKAKDPFLNPEEASNIPAEATMLEKLKEDLPLLHIPCMVVTMDKDGAVFMDQKDQAGHVPARRVKVVDTTGAGDSFFAATAASLIYGASLQTACENGARIAEQVIGSEDSSIKKERR